MEKHRQPPPEVTRLQGRVAELEDLLRSSGRLTSLRHSLDDIFEGVQILDRDWRYLYLNATAAGHGKRENEDLLGQRIQAAYPGIEETAVFARMQRCMEARLPDQMLNEFTYPDGTRAWFDLRMRPVPAGLLVLSVDVTKQMRIQEELARSRENLSRILACLTDGVITIDITGKILRINPAAERILGRTREDAVGKTLRDLARLVKRQRLDELELPLEYILSGKRPWAAPEGTTLITITGRNVPVELTGTALRDRAGQAHGCVLVLRDRSEEHQITEMLHHAQKMEAVGRLAGGIAHDFNNLLTIMTGTADLILSGVVPASEHRMAIKQIADAGRRGAALTRQLLSFSRRQPVHRERQDLNAVLAAAEPMLRRLLGEDIDLQISLGEGVHPVLIDAGYVDQIVMNLAMNARDAMPEGGRLRLETSNVDLDAEYALVHPHTEPGPYACISVMDSGTGIDEATRQRMFEPYFTTKGPGQGTGLGLSTVYGIVSQHGGSIDVVSEPGAGATFKVHLPRMTGSEAPEPEPALPSHPDLGAAASGLVVLVVEDADPVREFLGVVLAREGYVPLLAASVEEALQQSRAQPGPIHLLLTDIVLPDDSGPELARQLVAERPELRLAFMSGYTDDTVMRRGDVPVGAPFLEKPILPAQLLACVRQALEAGS